jgi:ATP adenylyltransferase/5',5'''-P-1,P-4-tetraphosphate phosphorylase II
MLEEEVKNLYTEQQKEWKDFAEHVKDLKKIEKKTFDFGNYKVISQFNPARAVSSGAKLDPDSIKSRKCFLCPENRPSVQRGLTLNDKFILLVNPFPILDEHFTISLIRHENQEILPYLPDMLFFAEKLPGYIIFYNGPKAGASAPDHMHFQATRKGQLPLEAEYKTIEKKILSADKKGSISQFQHFGRKCFMIESGSKETVISFFRQLYIQFQLFMNNTEEEPLLNLFTMVEDGKWLLFVFPRKVHRPAIFYAEGKENKMISPGAVDMAGILVLPRKKDFESLTKEIISGVYNEVSL